ncbi:MAG: hypothetical protein IJ053_06685 [Lachnospiraceae bacterium]|nr:hypothetical protein [Lachnospiraceae bacterium]MBQ9610239.1 hypothetical protein [Lachnospiraceae bacterium]
MSKSNICILLVLFAILIAGGVYFYVYKPNMEDKESIDSEISTLETRYNELKAMEVHRDEYIAQTAEYNEKFEDEIEIFPATLDQEISVMFMKGIEKDQGNLQFNISTVGLGQEEMFYTLGAGAGSAQATEGSDTVITAANSSYDCYRATFPISYTGSYEGIKDLVDYIMTYKYRMNVTALNIAYDASADTYSGNITLSAYSVSGGDRQADSITTDTTNGVSNLFLGGSGASAPSSTGGSATSASANDARITLNNANNDSTPGVVVSSGSNSASYSDNDVVTIDLTVDETDGKVTGTFSVDGKDVTVDLAEGATSFRVYVKSSDRVDGDDSNGVKLNVTNNSGVNVDIKVDGDDSSSPRFSIGSRSGSVSVN